MEGSTVNHQSTWLQEAMTGKEACISNCIPLHRGVLRGTLNFIETRDRDKKGTVSTRAKALHLRHYGWDPLWKRVKAHRVYKPPRVSTPSPWETMFVIKGGGQPLDSN